jgi:hypothetical protein
VPSEEAQPELGVDTRQAMGEQQTLQRDGLSTYSLPRFLGAIGGAIAGSLAEDYAKDKKHGGHSPGRQSGSSQGGFMDQASGFFKK